MWCAWDVDSARGTIPRSSGRNGVFWRGYFILRLLFQLGNGKYRLQTRRPLFCCSVVETVFCMKPQRPLATELGQGVDHLGVYRLHVLGVNVGPRLLRVTILLMQTLHGNLHYLMGI